MKTYIDHNTIIQFNELWIPKDPANRDYQQFLKELAKGEAELVPFVPPPPTWPEIRSQRDQLLQQSDWAIIADATPKPNKEAWLTYRQALRNVPQNFPTPEAVVWPTKP